LAAISHLSNIRSIPARNASIFSGAGTLACALLSVQAPMRIHNQRMR
jgi:hypothetical protein